MYAYSQTGLKTIYLFIIIDVWNDGVSIIHM